VPTRLTLLLALAVLAMSVPSMAADTSPAPEAAEPDVMPSSWSLENVRKPRRAPVRNEAQAVHRGPAQAQADRKPRIRAGVTASSGRNRTRSGAKVGIGVPF
jgi:hypothetical protein